MIDWDKLDLAEITKPVARFVIVGALLWMLWDMAQGGGTIDETIKTLATVAVGYYMKADR